jgi:hypothetical protein
VREKQEVTRPRRNRRPGDKERLSACPGKAARLTGGHEAKNRQEARKPGTCCQPASVQVADLLCSCFLMIS